MSDFKAKMRQINFYYWGSAPVPQTPPGSLQRSPDLLAVVKGPTFKRTQEEERGSKR